MSEKSYMDILQDRVNEENSIAHYGGMVEDQKKRDIIHLRKLLKRAPLQDLRVGGFQVFQKLQKAYPLLNEQETLAELGRKFLFG